jgi:two-component system, LytTR family, response regulator
MMNATTTIDVMLIDNDPLARQRIRQFLREYEECTIVGECDGGRAAVAHIRALHPDLIFLDLQMPDVNGLEVLAALEPHERPLVVFVTTHDENALRAFQVHALDYLVKPFDRERFREAYQRARARAISQAQQGHHVRLSALLAEAGLVSNGTPAAAARSPDRIVIKTGTRVLFLDPTEIDWVEAAGNYVRLHVGSQEYIVRESITRLEATLRPHRFARVHRSSIVNLNRVRELRPWFSGEMIIVMQNGTEVKLSRTYRKELERRVHILS